jgi:subtilisin family serine protease
MKKTSPLPILFVLIAAFLITSNVSGQGPARVRKSARNRSRQTKSRIGAKRSLDRYITNQVLIQLVRDAGDYVKSAIAKKSEGLLLQTVSAADQERGELLLASLPLGKTAKSAIAEFRGLPGVAFVQYNWIYTIQQSTSNDTWYRNGDLWGMYSDDKPAPIGPVHTTNPNGCQAEKAWAAGHLGSRSIYVGVLDQGVQIDHPDLSDNIWTNPGETGTDSEGHDKATNHKDDDGDGFIDDVHGWDFYHDYNDVYGGGASGIADQHGTHVAGTIGAVGGNGQGVVGVNWYVTMIPAKFIGPAGGPTAKAVRAIDYIVKLKTEKKLNIVAINASWQGGGFDLCLLEAIKRAARENILFIAGAGNNGFDNDSSPFYPACYDTMTDTTPNGGTPPVAYDSVISVAAIDSYGNLASNYGLKTVDLGAPGIAIVSTWPYNDYRFDNGTSMAAPHVTGAVALYASTHPGATAESIKFAILDAARHTPTTSLSGKTVTGGRLNVGSF